MFGIILDGYYSLLGEAWFDHDREHLGYRASKRFFLYSNKTIIHNLLLLNITSIIEVNEFALNYN